MEIIPDNENRQEEEFENNDNREVNTGMDENSQEASLRGAEAGNPRREARSTSDEAWAERLGLKYDPEIASRPVPPPYPAPAPQASVTPTPPPPYPTLQQAPFIESEPMPKTYMLWSILSVVFCCFIPGIVAIIYSAQVSSKYYAKDYEGARRASERAQGWIIASIVCGVISAAFYLPLTLMGS